jgi:DUF971 family protein
LAWKSGPRVWKQWFDPMPTPEIQALEVSNHRATGMLEIIWSDGTRGVTAHRLLREACRCAQCTAVSRCGTPVIAENGIRITLIEPYGNNALRLGFDDGHGRGLYPFEYLRLLEAQALSAPGG